MLKWNWRDSPWQLTNRRPVSHPGSGKHAVAILSTLLHERTGLTTGLQDLKDFARQSGLDVVYSEVTRERDVNGNSKG